MFLYLIQRNEEQNKGQTKQVVMLKFFHFYFAATNLNLQYDVERIKI